MKRHLRRTGVRVVLVVVSAFGAVWWTVDTVWSMQEPKEVTSMSTQMKTVCIGRFLIDVPESAQVSIASAAVDGFNIINYGAETPEQFAARLTLREEQINAKKNKAGNRNMESIRDVNHDRVHGKVFVFGLNSTHGFHGDEKIVLSGVAINGYVNVDGQTFGFTADDYNPKEADNLVHLIEKLQPLSEGVIPTQPGFCLNGALIRDPLTASQRERIVMFGGIPGHADLGFAISTMAGIAQDGESLLARHAATAGSTFGLMNVLVSTLLKGARNIGGLDGEELAFKVRETNFSTGYSFQWEMEGEEHDVLKPFVSIELQTGTNPQAGGPPVHSTLSEASLGDLWRRMSSSLRLRPVEQRVAMADADRQLGLALGTVAWAGAPCRQSGWWQCGEAAADVGVFGGERQFLRAGAVMPQALLLPRPSVWQKVRGLQPSYETTTPTSWRLADKRVQDRRRSNVGLAEPTPAALALHSETAMAAPGSIARSGEACPASGWWRCLDAQALDETRWFARGVALPPATYRLTGGGVKRRAGNAQLIARQAGWQLMRLAGAAAVA